MSVPLRLYLLVAGSRQTLVTQHLRFAESFWIIRKGLLLATVCYFPLRQTFVCDVLGSTVSWWESEEVSEKRK